MKKSGLIVLLLWGIQSALGQTEFGKGYLILNSGDTVKGYFERGMEAAMASSALFKENLSAPAKKYSVGDIRAYALDEERYTSIFFENGALDHPKPDSVFGRLLVEGPVMLFTFWRSDHRYYIIRKDGNNQLIFNSSYRSTGELNMQGNFNSRVALLLGECPNLIQKYKTPSYSQKEMTNMVFELNNCLKSGSAKSYYHKTKTLTEIYAFLGGLPLGDQSQFTGEFYFRFISPRLSNHTSLNVGFRYANVISVSTSLNSANLPYKTKMQNIIYSVPVTLQYNILTGRIRPFIYAGFSIVTYKEIENGQDVTGKGFQENFGATFVLGGGVEVRIIKNLYIRADYRYEIVSQFPAVGIAYQFK